MTDGFFMINLLLIGILVTHAEGAGSLRKAVSTVVGGNKADRNEYPWQILLFYGNRFQCGGSILNEWTVMTVAHCIIRDEFQKRKSYSITAGERNREVVNGKEQIIKVKTIVKHAGFDDETFENDIALLHLEAPLVFKRGVQPVNLTDEDFGEREIIKGNCYATGYGLVKNFPFNKLPKVLQELKVQVISNSRCNKRLKQYEERAEDSMVCTYDEGIGVCQGDSGSPLGCFDRHGNYRQVGIVSWTPTANCLVPPSVYTRVGHFLDWINENMYNGPGS